MATAIKEMSDKELDSYLDDARRELLSLRSNYAVTRSLQKPSAYRPVKAKRCAHSYGQKRKRVAIR